MQQSLTQQQQLAVELLVTGMKCADIVSNLEIDRTTLWRWRKEEKFIRELANQNNELRTATKQRLRGKILPMVLDRLEERLDPENAMDHVSTSQILQIVRMTDTNLPPEVPNAPDSLPEQDTAPPISQDAAPPSDQQSPPKPNGRAIQETKPKPARVPR